MARLTYQAPGVYVEEVPSARQPIAGVGTNTAAFIGIVPDTIYYPVPNPDYDPVAADAALRLKLLLIEKGKLEASDNEQDKKQLETVDTEIAKVRSDLEETLARLRRELTGLETKRTKAEQDFHDAEKALTDLGPETDSENDDQKAKRRAANLKVTAKRGAFAEAGTKVTEKQQALNDASVRLKDSEKVATSSPTSTSETKAGPLIQQEITEYLGKAPSDDLLKKSVLRPYMLVKFDVRAEPLDTRFCTNFTEYTNRFGPFSMFNERPEPQDGTPPPNPDFWQYRPQYPGHHALTHAVYGFFNNGGTRCFVARINSVAQLKDTLTNFESIDDVAIISAPGLPKEQDYWTSLADYSETHENVFAILDSPEVVNKENTNDFDIDRLSSPGTGSVPRICKNAAYYFPHIEVVDPAKQLQDTDPARQVSAKYRGRTHVPPSGHMAGVYARTDEERGVHKAPANCVVRGAINVKYYVSKPVQEQLNPNGINAIRMMNGAVTVWGARTIGGDRNGEWKYIPVRRFFLFLQESIDEGTQWVVFEPNDYALWAKIRLNVTAFLTNIWRSGALFGMTPEEAFYVKCDAELNPPEVRDLGQVITEIGVAIVRPAEFVIFRISQSTGLEKS
ncbi:phage tail sheath C-terminal domain-containing protein [Nitrosospira sp. Is2]|uniref:phage tail sheath C-terminal domain-containing protein n=1 Tax=Nitrosospira sp. Is2 TaxID=3080532 RepID=UPI002955CF49|nr:phage tail sheath C-terminal domain-containing protein [Nitrosospira sp. Is2]WON73508.1 phage tail sheath C-terminal domain-containing protein [Nitrosospira sp. Is2]